MILSLIKLIRPKHWLKNGLIFVPLVFSGQLLDASKFTTVLMGAIAFSLLASSIYIINDIRDVKKDRLHPTKKSRPIASGKVSIRLAYVVFFGLLAIVLVLGILSSFNIWSWSLLLIYLVINIGYSFGLKNIPVIDIAILSAGFVIRVFYGGEVADISVSVWLYMTVLVGAVYLSLGKRRNEIKTHGAATRSVNKHYSVNFLDKNMSVFLGLLLVFYSLWTIEGQYSHSLLYLTIPLLMLLFMRYSLAIESNESSGDPVNVLTSSRTIMVLAVIYIVATISLVYIR